MLTFADHELSPMAHDLIAPLTILLHFLF